MPDLKNNAVLKKKNIREIFFSSMTFWKKNQKSSKRFGKKLVHFGNPKLVHGPSH